MTNNLVFEHVNEENLEEIVRLQRDIFPDEDGRKNYVETIEHNPYRKELHNWIVRRISDNTPVGIVGFYSYHEYPDDAWLGWFGVVPSERKHGYGSIIIDFFEEFSKENGYKNIRLYTDENDNSVAVSFYKHRGMLCERYTNPGESDEVTATTLVFSKSLTNKRVGPWNNRFLELTKQFEKEKNE